MSKSTVLTLLLMAQDNKVYWQTYLLANLKEEGAISLFFFLSVGQFNVWQFIAQ
ncbi:MAG: hypothetical protein WKF90_06710 [Pyrinomonadaceae bacterium]